MLTQDAPESIAVARRFLASVWMPGSVGAFAMVLALVGSWNVSLWADEAATVSAIQRTPVELWQLLFKIDAVHGVYYAFMQAWTGLFGFSPTSLRLPSALAVGIAAAGVCVLASRITTARAALISGLAFGLLPRVTWAGIEARSFGFTAAFAVWLTILLLACLRRGGWLWLTYLVLSGVAIAVNIFVALLLLSHLISAFLFRRRAPRSLVGLIGAAAGGLALASPVLVLAVREKGQLGDAGFDFLPFIRSFLVNQWFLGQTPTRVDASSSAFAIWSVAAVILAIGCWSMVALGIARWRSNAAPPRTKPGDFLVIALPWLIVPTVAVGLYSATMTPLYNPRYFTFCTPAMAVLIGIGLSSIRRPGRRLLVAVLLITATIPIYISQREVHGKSGTDWSETAAIIDRHARPGDGVYFPPLRVNGGSVIGPTTRGISTAYPDPFASLRDLTIDATPATDTSLTGASRPLSRSAIAINSVDRIWVIYRDDYPPRAIQADEKILASHGFVATSTWTGSMDVVTEFTRR